MAEENSYNTLYLHNVIIEFISFVVILIEDHGPRSLRNINNHLNFFSKDIYNFIEIFNGKDTEEKIGDMLCTTTPIFDVKERILYLSDNYRHFKQLIYKEFLTSKIIDLVLRGICFVKDICRNLNMNSIINIEEDNLKTMLKRSTYFSLNSDNVIVLHFHGLLGFNNHIYNGVVKYFQSYLQNINLLTYNEIKWHAKFVPSCSVLNCLVIFCVLHVSTIFKCEKDEVRLKKKFKRKNSGNKIINVEELKIKSSEAIPVGQIVSRALGPVLRNWTGEITQVTKSNGLIQCVVNFANSYGIFVIYFYKSALKYVCELEDLRDYLSIRDSVEFDAEFSEEEIQQGIFWQAIHVRVTKQALKKSKFEIDIDADMYMEKIKCNYNTFKVSSKTCKNCTANYCALESDIKNINKTVRGKESFSNSTNLNIKKATNLCCKQSKPLKNSYTLSQYHTLNGVVATNMLKSDDIILQSPTEELTTDKRIPKDYLNKKDVTIQDSKICNSNLQVQEQHISKVDLAVNKSIVSIASKEINHPKDFEVCDNKEEAIKDYDRKTLIPSSDKSFFQEVNGKNLHSKSDLISLEKNEKTQLNTTDTCITRYAKEKSSLDDIFLPNLLFLHSMFVFGTITVATDNEGVAVTLHTQEQHEIFFSHEAIFCQKTEKMPNKNNVVLLFIPHFELKDNVFVATLVYPLNLKDSTIVREQYITVEDFVLNYFIPDVMEKDVDKYSCYCDIPKTLISNSKINFENKRKVLFKGIQFIKNLQDIFNFSTKTLSQFQIIINILYVRNMGVNHTKLLSYIMYILKQAMSLTCCSKRCVLANNVKGIKYKRRPYKDSFMLHHFEKKSLTNLDPAINKECTFSTIKIPEIIFESNNLDVPKSNEFTDKTKIMQAKPFMDSEYDSCTSISSNKSCNSKSSDDVFHSCESLSEILDSSSELDESKNSLMQSNQSLCEVNSSVDLNSSITENVDYPNEAKIAISNVRYKFLKKGKFEKNTSYRLRHCSFFKCKDKSRRKYIISLPSQNSFSKSSCKNCYRPILEKTACISIISKTCLYFSIKSQQQYVTLSFPVNLVPKKVLKNIKLHAMIKVGLIPHVLPHLSHVLYMDTI